MSQKRSNLLTELDYSRQPQLFAYFAKTLFFKKKFY